MRDFFDRHFDKMLMAVFAAYLIHVVRGFAVAPETVSWARELTSGFVGALIGLVTGIHMGKEEQKKEDKKDEVK